MPDVEELLLEELYCCCYLKSVYMHYFWFGKEWQNIKPTIGTEVKHLSSYGVDVKF